LTGRICGPSKQAYRRLESDGEDEALMPHDKTSTLGHENLVAHVPDSVSCYRITLILIVLLIKVSLTKTISSTCMHGSQLNTHKLIKCESKKEMFYLT
jgi:hypothetical protein